MRLLGHAHGAARHGEELQDVVGADGVRGLEIILARHDLDPDLVGMVVGGGTEGGEEEEREQAVRERAGGAFA